MLRWTQARAGLQTRVRKRVCRALPFVSASMMKIGRLPEAERVCPAVGHTQTLEIRPESANACAALCPLYPR